MSEYQKAKARAIELQKLKDQSFQRELAEKEEKERQLKRDEEERRKKKEAAIKEARRVELIKANEALVGVGVGVEVTVVTKAGNGGGKVGNGAISKGKDLEWNPFAEDEKRVGGSNALSGPSQTSIKSNGNPSSRPRTISTSKERKNANPSSRQTRETTPPGLSRKEKAARAFLQQTKMHPSDSSLSVRSLVDSREAKPASLSPRPPPKPNPLFPTPASTRTVLGGKIELKRKMGKHGLGKGMNGKDELRVLCPDRSTRDRRTIDEIQKDIVKARGGDDVGVGRNGKTGGPVDRVHGQKANGNGHRNGLEHVNGRNSRSLSPTKGIIKTPKAKPPPIPTSARPIKPSHTQTHSQTPKNRRARSPSSSTSSTSSSSTSSPRDRKRARYSPDLATQSAISRQIQDMFRRPDRPPPGRVVYSDEEDGDDDMEAGLSDVEAEERRAAVLARKEDEAAEREEREHRERKERLRREREREKGGKGRA